MHEVLAPALGGAAVGWFAYFRWRAGRVLRAESWHRRLGAPIPELPELPDARGGRVGWREVRGRVATAIVFMSNRCPGVKAYDGRLAALQRQYGDRGVRFVGVNPIDDTLYSSETLERMADARVRRGLDIPYVKDAMKEWTRAFHAECTPQVFVVDGRDRLVYEGRIDDAFVEPNVTKHYLRDALDDVVAGRRPRTARTRPLGCAIDSA